MVLCKVSKLDRPMVSTTLTVLLLTTQAKDLFFKQNFDDLHIS